MSEEKVSYGEEDSLFAERRLLRELSGTGDSITVKRFYCKAMGSLEGGVFLSQLVFWSDKGRDGWFYKTYAEWEEEIFVSKYQVGKFSDFCVEQGFLEVKTAKANGAPTVHYRLSLSKFSLWIVKFLTNQESENFDFPSSNFSLSYKQKNTTEEYQKNTQKKSTTTPEPVVETPEDRQPFGDILRYYKRNVGKVNEAVEDMLWGEYAKHGADRLLEALKTAVLNNKQDGKPSARFILAILDRMAREDEQDKLRAAAINKVVDPNSDPYPVDPNLAYYRQKLLEGSE